MNFLFSNIQQIIDYIESNHFFTQESVYYAQTSGTNHISDDSKVIVTKELLNTLKNTIKEGYDVLFVVDDRN